MYAYNADVWCDSCAGKIIASLRDSGATNDGDSDSWPQWARDDEESDSPQHCAAGEECDEAETLPSGRKIGALMGSLTEYGADYVVEAHDERPNEVTERWLDFYGVDPVVSDENYINAFLAGYIECALWSSTDESTDSGGDPLEDDYDDSDIDEDARSAMREDCIDFLTANWRLLHAYADARGMALQTSAEYAGHDFWLTRNGHGAGFWDRGIGDVGAELTKAAHVYGESNVYVGDDGRLYVSP